jgi:cyclohexadienyl dehydratase
MDRMTVCSKILALGLMVVFASFPAYAGKLESITADKKMRVCIWPEYYGISYRNPKTQKLNGVDVDMALELGKELGAEVEFVDSSFAKLIPDVTDNKCDVAMFGVGINPTRAAKLRFTQPTLASDVYAITTQSNRRMQSWADIDKAGTVVAVLKGTLHEPLMRAQLTAASLLVLDSPLAREQEVQSGRADVFMTDFPYTRRMQETTDWARLIVPNSTYHMTPYAYAIAPGDDKWFNRLQLFVRDIKRDGRLINSAKRYKLDPIVLLD